MRISDWSSDVCSSDLDLAFHHDRALREERHAIDLGRQDVDVLVDQQHSGACGLELAKRMYDAVDAAVSDAGKGFIQEHDLGFLHQHASHRSEEHTSELQSLMRISYAVFCLKK